MMRQYLAIKAEHPDALVFYRMGDFYELFLEDAEVAAPLLDITLTTRDKGKPDAIPMCGIPVHSADGYLRKLTELGRRVAICEQVEDPRSVGGKRLVKREVVEVVTPGLVGDPEGLVSTAEVAVVALARTSEGIGLAAFDASTGRFRATRSALEGPLGLPSAVLDELERIAPRELLCVRGGEAELGHALAGRLEGVARTEVPAESFETDGFTAGSADVLPDGPETPVPHGFEPGSNAPEQRAAACVLRYVQERQPAALARAPRLQLYGLRDTMVLDAATRRHLELFESSEDRTRQGTLIERIDLCVTPLGARRLSRWLAYPLLDPVAIGARQDAVASLAERDRLRSRLREALAPVRDLERIMAKVARPTAEPRDLAALRSSLEALPEVARLLDEGAQPGGAAELPLEAAPALPLPRPAVPEATTRLLEDSLVDDPKPLPRGSRGASETGYVRPGFRPELDVLRESATKGREWIAGLEVRERERIGVPGLKVRFHPVHGYSLEVSKAQLARVPDDYERKQTLANAERFTTPELREMESKVLGAHDRAAALEREILEDVRNAVLAEAALLRDVAESVSELDALQSLAEVARRDDWVRPEVDDSTALSITGGRHPVVEGMLGRSGGDAFVPNDADLDPDATRILVITGPNMSGKSTYLRQVALLVLLAQMGSFVPAEAARIGAVDRVFTRVGASDRLARGESTFMVEMRETADILRLASPRSLVILDEIGRGTSTFDGLSIAWAVVEYLHDTPGLGARTLFATHYHELADLCRERPGVRNAHFEAREWEDEVVFLRRLVSGPANRSYGIQVARLAGLPPAVITRAREVLQGLEEEDRMPGAAEDAQLGLFQRGAAPAPAPVQAPESREERAGRLVLEALRELDPDRTTPMDALALLSRWQRALREEDPS